jgi:hypothetical protein
LTLKNRCVSCDQVIEANDSMRGQEIACPRCEATNVLLSVEDARRRESGAEKDQERERRTFLSSLESRRQPQPAAGWRAPPSGGPLDSSAAQDLALLAGRRLKDSSVYLLFFGYVLLLMSLAAALGIVFWADVPFAWKALGVASSTFFGLTVFVFFKLMSDTVQALSDLTDLGRSIDQRLAELGSGGAQPVANQEDRSAAPGEVLSPRG